MKWVPGLFSVFVLTVLGVLLLQGEASFPYAEGEHGITVHMKLERSDYELGESIPLQAFLTNGGSYTIRVWPSLFSLELLWKKNRNEQIKYHAPLSGSDITQSTSREVGPGQTLELALYADPDDLAEVGIEHPGNYVAGLRYQGTLTAVFEENGEKQNRAWLPVLKSGSQKIRLMPPGALGDHDGPR
ncbi:MAG: hypothetical protein HYY14_06810 [Candidatus Omnitrophica bacterium]|nr:hypothetical protein [Candidatus Omnitrophota bacterium]